VAKADNEGYSPPIPIKVRFIVSSFFFANNFETHFPLWLLSSSYRKDDSKGEEDPDEMDRTLSDIMKILDKGSVLVDEAVDQPTRHVVDTLICVLKGITYMVAPSTPASIALDSFRTAVDEWEVWLSHHNNKVQHKNKRSEAGEDDGAVQHDNETTIDGSDPEQRDMHMIHALLMINITRCMSPSVSFPVAKAVRYATQAVNILTQLTGSESHKTTSALDALAQLYYLSGELARSEALLRSVSEIGSNSVHHRLTSFSPYANTPMQ
jgi:hypothetical protein